MIAKLKALHYNEYGFHVSKGDMDMKFMKKLLVASLPWFVLSEEQSLPLVQ